MSPFMIIIIVIFSFFVLLHKISINKERKKDLKRKDDKIAYDRKYIGKLENYLFKEILSK